MANASHPKAVRNRRKRIEKEKEKEEEKKNHPSRVERRWRHTNTSIDRRRCSCTAHQVFMKNAQCVFSTRKSYSRSRWAIVTIAIYLPLSLEATRGRRYYRGNCSGESPNYYIALLSLSLSCCLLGIYRWFRKWFTVCNEPIYWSFYGYNCRLGPFVACWCFYDGYNALLSIVSSIDMLRTRFSYK